MYIDFAEMLSEANAWVSSKRGISSYSYDGLGTWTTRTPITHTWGESADQGIKTGVRLSPNMGVQGSWEAATTLGGTEFKGQSPLLHSFYIGMNGSNAGDFVLPLPFADKVEEFKGEIPAILNNRMNKKVEYVKTFVVHTTPEKYGAAVMDVTNKFFDDIIEYYKLVRPAKK